MKTMPKPATGKGRRCPKCGKAGCTCGKGPKRPKGY